MIVRERYEDKITDANTGETKDFVVIYVRCNGCNRPQVWARFNPKEYDDFLSFKCLKGGVLFCQGCIKNKRVTYNLR